MNTTIHQSTLSIADAPKLLRFEHKAAPSFQPLIKDFRALVTAKFNAFLAEASQESADPVRKLREKVATFSEDEFNRILTMPAFLNHIFRARGATASNKVTFWNLVLDQQISVRDNQIDTSKWTAFWTLDGGTFMRSQGEDKDLIRFDSHLLYDSIILDFFSEVNAGLGGDQYLAFDSDEEMSDYSFEEAEALMEKFESCLAPTNARVTDLLKTFAHVVHFRKAVGSIATSSSTNGGYIGRVLIGNAGVFEPELLAEAMVHESIHGILFMLDELNTWMPGTREDASQTHFIRSPWSGNLLTPRNIFQATFVWYGLYHFWNTHLDAYPNKKLMTSRMDLIRKGFGNLPTESLLPERFPQTFETIQLIATEVVNHHPGN